MRLEHLLSGGGVLRIAQKVLGAKDSLAPGVSTIFGTDGVNTIINIIIKKEQAKRSPSS